MQFPITRMRRLRKNSKIRDIVRETKLQKEDLIYPIYFKQDLKEDEKEEISSLPGEFRYSLKSGVEFAKKLEKATIETIENGEMTGDLVGMFAKDGVTPKKLNSKEFLYAIQKRI